jgi:uncharacterized SAM-binding protein YcdF (DUF218 family)
MARQTNRIRRRTARDGNGRRGFGWWASRILGLAVLVWAAGFVVFVLAQAGPAPDGLETDGVAVLTGGPLRAARGVKVLEDGLARRMLISGVDPSVRPEELALAAGIRPGLFKCCVDLGFEADSTRSNAAEVALWVERHRFRSVRLVTAGYHMRRARMEVAARLPADVTIVPDGVSAGLPLSAMLWEYLKLQGSWITLRVRPA